MRFRDRVDAGNHLARQLKEHAFHSPSVFGIPRGGIPVAAEVANELDAPLEAFVTLKVGAPGHEELGIGAVAEGLEMMVVTGAARASGIDASGLARLAKRVDQEVERRISLYRNACPLPEIIDREVIVVDDGLATGVTAAAALEALRQGRPRRLVLAVPVGDRDAASRLATFADDVVCVLSPAHFSAVGEFYKDFSQTTDKEVLEALALRRSEYRGAL
jgi:putative phosphoribosyl transferase